MHFSSRSICCDTFRGLNNISGLGFARGLINGYRHGLASMIGLPPRKRDNPLINTDLDTLPAHLWQRWTILFSWKRDIGQVRISLIPPPAGALPLATPISCFCFVNLLGLVMQIYFSPRWSYHAHVVSSSYNAAALIADTLSQRLLLPEMNRGDRFEYGRRNREG